VQFLWTNRREKLKAFKNYEKVAKTTKIAQKLEFLDKT